MTMAQIPDVISIAAGLGAETAMACDIHVFEQLDSTSAWLRNERKSLDTCLTAGRSQLCVTDWQQAGVGRRGKSWQTRPGNITFSVLSRVSAPAKDLVGLSLVTGIAVAEAVEGVLDVDVKLKWPNDVILRDRKLGGLLTEVITVTHNAAPVEGAGRDRDSCLEPVVETDVVTGIGINVNHDDAVSTLGIGATSLAEAGLALSAVARDELVGRIASSVLMLHERFITHGWSSFRQSWERRDWLAGKAVVIHRDDSTEQAIACGVNEQGALLVDGADGVRPLYGGNVSIRPTV